MSLPRHLSFLIFVFIITSIIGCDKDPDPDIKPNPIDPSTFSMKIDGKLWVPTDLSVFYYKSYQQLIIVAKDTTAKISIAIELDTVNYNGMYNFAAFNGNVAKIEFKQTTYYSYLDITDAGGVLSLTSFNKSSKKASGSASLLVFGKDKSSKLQLTEIKFKDLPFEIDESDESDGRTSYTITGKKSATIVSKDVYAYYACVLPGFTPIASLKLLSPLSDIEDHYLRFDIPMNGNLGTFSIFPTTGAISCNNTKVVSEYRFHSGNSSYLPSTGSITISVADTISKTLKATFNLTLINSANPQDILDIQNGKVEITSWH